MDKWKKGLIWAAGIALLIALRRAVGRIALLLLVASTLAYLLCPLERLFRATIPANGEGGVITKLKEILKATEVSA